MVVTTNSEVMVGVGCSGNNSLSVVVATMMMVLDY